MFDRTGTQCPTPKMMKARVSPVQSIEPHRILAPTQDSNLEPPGPQSRVVTTILPLKWFGYVERKSGDDWVSACRNVVVAGARCAGRSRKTFRECVKDDMDELGLHSEWVVFIDMWRDHISGKTSNPN